MWAECLRSRHETCDSRGSEVEVFLCSLEPTLVGWFLDLKTPGKIAGRHSACAPSGQGPKQGVVSRIFRF